MQIIDPDRIDSALSLINSIKDQSVLFVGDTIIDEYHYVHGLGRSPKEHLIPVEYESKETFQGGVVAAANHARSFCRHVDICTSSPMTKVRFVEQLYTRKVFEIHYPGDITPCAIPDLTPYDTIVVTDFGHGTLHRFHKDRLSNAPEFVAVNAQTNSSNIGYNLITNYHTADYIVIDQPEARLAAANRNGEIEDVILKLAEGRCDKFIVTLGSEGSIGYDGTSFHYLSAFTNRVVDTMGAGDAFFAITAPMAKYGSIEDLLLIGNAAGAIKTQIVGHRQSVTKGALIEYLTNN